MKLSMLIIIQVNKEEEDISIAKYINIKLWRVRKIRILYNYKRWPIETVQL